MSSLICLPALPVIPSLGFFPLRLAPLKVVSNVATNAADQMKAAAAGAGPTKLLSSVRTIFVASNTRFLKPSQLENEIRKRPEYKTLGLRIVSDKKLDLEIQLDRCALRKIERRSPSALLSLMTACCRILKELINARFKCATLSYNKKVLFKNGLVERKQGGIISRTRMVGQADMSASF